MFLSLLLLWFIFQSIFFQFFIFFNLFLWMLGNLFLFFYFFVFMCLLCLFFDVHFFLKFCEALKKNRIDIECCNKCFFFLIFLFFIFWTFDFLWIYLIFSLFFYIFFSHWFYDCADFFVFMLLFFVLKRFLKMYCLLFTIYGWLYIL